MSLVNLFLPSTRKHSDSEIVVPIAPGLSIGTLIINSFINETEGNVSGVLTQKYGDHHCLPCKHCSQQPDSPQPMLTSGLMTIPASFLLLTCTPKETPDLHDLFLYPAGWVHSQIPNIFLLTSSPPRDPDVDK